MNMIDAFRQAFRRDRWLIEEASSALSDEDFFRRPAPQVNSIALIIKHLSGNLASRWSDFLTTDGDKPARDRDREFVLGDADTREALLQQWQQAWGIVEATLGTLAEDDLARVVTIRGEPHTVLQALIRGLDHAAYHAGQVLYIARLLRPDAPWLTIPPGQSKSHGRGQYLSGK